VDEGGFGNYEDKVIKIGKARHGLRWPTCWPVATVGVVEPRRRPVGWSRSPSRFGVVAALIPTTGPDATPTHEGTVSRSRAATRSSCPRIPRTYETTVAVVGYMREACRQVGAPEELIQTVAETIPGQDPGTHAAKPI